MKITVEKHLCNFEFWGGAPSRAELLSQEDFARIERVLENIYPDGMTKTEVNNIFWFEEDWLAECLGFKDWKELESAKNRF